MSWSNYVFPSKLTKLKSDLIWIRETKVRYLCHFHNIPYFGSNLLLHELWCYVNFVYLRPKMYSFCKRVILLLLSWSIWLIVLTLRRLHYYKNDIRSNFCKNRSITFFTRTVSKGACKNLVIVLDILSLISWPLII